MILFGRLGTPNGRHRTTVRKQLEAIVLQLSAWVFVGSGIGGVLRLWCSGLLARTVGETFPWGTLAVNVLGSFLIGLVATVTGPDGRVIVGPAARQFVLVGMFGGFTTFSSFSLQTLTLARDGQWWLAGANVALSLALCLIAVWLGYISGMTLNR
ncbi:MAG: fluoride efflux transporter CrcB [Rhodospirillales bacterium]|nr:fluoride efflux transporter CrcB [Rhodospirillales bacterium]